jgi:hypothetical protein
MRAPALAGARCISQAAMAMGRIADALMMGRAGRCVCPIQYRQLGWVKGINPEIHDRRTLVALFLVSCA